LLKPEALIRRQAAKLLVRADADPTPENFERLERWRASDPRHARALAKAEAVLASAGLLAQSSIVLERRSDIHIRPRRVGTLAIAASIAAVLLLAPILFLLFAHRSPVDSTIEAVMLSTGPGETRAVTLADGSRLVMAGSSAVRVDLAPGRRNALVEKGRARFSITRGGPPFMVSSGDTSVRMNEGIVDVSQRTAATHVELISGAAEISSLSDPERRERIGAPAAIDRPLTVGRETVAAGSSKFTRLSFDGARLADVVASANRYGGHQIIIDDPDIANLRVTLVYRAGDTDGLARSLADAFQLEVHEDSSGDLLVERDSSRTS
jgi:transmembrane sensor